MKKHSILAVVSDYYFFSYIYGVVLGLISIIFNTPTPLSFILIMFFVGIILSILYHSFISKKVKFITPGEIIGGVVLNNGEKKVENLYGKNRFFLYAVLLINIIFYGNSWDGLSSGVVMPFSKFISISIFLFLVVAGVSMAMRNNKKWVFILSIPSVISLSSVLVNSDELNKDVAKESVEMISNIVVGIYVFIIIINILAYYLFSVRNGNIEKVEAE